MVKEAWNSLKDNIKDRITNPFLGTFVIVWIAHNWQVVYSFFYFDKNWKLENKIEYFFAPVGVPQKASRRYAFVGMSPGLVYSLPTN